MRNLANALTLVLALLAVSLLTSCGGDSTPKPVPDFSLAVSPGSLSLQAGATSSAITVTAAALNSFNGSISVAISGLPTGVTANPSTLTLTPAQPSASITLTAAISVPSATPTITLTGTSGSLTHTATLALAVQAGPPPDFSLAVSPTTLSLKAGATSSAITVTATALNSFNGSISVAISGLPSGVTANPSTLTLTTAQPSATTTLAAAATVASATPTVTFTGTSGSLTHTATLALTVQAAPPPDFSLSVSPGSLSLNAGTTSSAVTVTETALNSFTGTVSVAITGLSTGVTSNPFAFTLSPAQPSATATFSAPITVAAATPTITFTGDSGSLSHTATLALTVQAAPQTIAPDVTTWHYDLARTGLNSQETILTPANVNSTQFGKTGFFSVDGKVDAQPLFLANVVIANAFHNILYVATEHGSVYAFDADTGAQIWHVSVLASGETTSDDHSCNQITPEIGVTSTPVIDRKSGPNGTLFTVGMSKASSGAYHQRLHALDLTTGAEISGSPTEIAATYPGNGDNSTNGNVVFDPAQYAERAALLLLNGTIYTTWTSHCDIGLYTGWVIAYSESSLQQTAVLNLTPNGHEGSAWMAGAGMAADSTASSICSMPTARSTPPSTPTAFPRSKTSATPC